MKRTFKLLAASIGLASILSVGATANAALINITNDLDDPPSLLNDFNKGDLAGLGNETVFEYLEATVAAWNSEFSPELPAPEGGGADGVDPLYAATDGDTANAVDLSLYTYVVVHYGKGKGGEGDGGGIVVWYTNGMTGDMSFDQKGSGPNGMGGNSWIRGYGPGGNGKVPDNGATIALLGLALGGLGFFAKFKSAKKA